MAKKTESKQTGQTVTPTAPENKAVISGNISEKADSVPESVSEKADSVPESVSDEQEPVSGDERAVEILNNDAELREDLTETLDEDTEKEQPEPEEKILFYVKTVNDKTAIRSTPEYPMAGRSNVTGIITDRGPHGIVDVVNGFGRIAGGTGWIMLDSSVVIRQG